MSALTLLIFTILFFAIAAIGGIYLLYYLLINFQPSQKTINKDLEILKAEIAPWIDQLVPWNKEELELLSLKQTNHVFKKKIITRAKGVFTSIYHEPLIAYTYKRYVGGGLNAILYARTSHHEFNYRIRNKEVQLNIDGQLIGAIRKGGLLYSARTDRLIGRLGENKEEGLLPVIIGNKELGSLALGQGEAMNTNDRAFQFLDEKISNEEEALLLSLSILEMVRLELPKE